MIVAINQFNQVLLLLGFIFICAIPINGSTRGLTSTGSLDRDAIKTMYFEGEFDQVVNALETFRKQHPDAREEDKIFMFKYLSVVYAASPETRDKGESYMYQLLKLVPTATLIDMYISDTIKAIFREVKKEYEERERFMKDSDGAQKPDKEAALKKQPDEPKPDTTATGTPEKKQKKNKKWIWWTAGGVAVVSVVAAFIILSGDDEPEPLIIND